MKFLLALSLLIALSACDQDNFPPPQPAPPPIPEPQPEPEPEPQPEPLEDEFVVTKGKLKVEALMKPGFEDHLEILKARVEMAVESFEK